MKVSERIAALAPPAASAATAYQRNPGHAGRWLDRAAADFGTAGKIEKLATVSDPYLASLIRADRAGFENLSRARADLIGRHAPLIEGAGALFTKIEAALAAGVENRNDRQK